MRLQLRTCSSRMIRLSMLFRSGAFPAHLADDDRHGGKRRSQFMRGPGSLRAQCHDTFVAQGIFAHTGELCIADAYRTRHLHGEIGHHHCADDEAQPHAEDMRVERIFQRRGGGNRGRGG